VHAIVSECTKLIETVLDLRPACRFVLTVSPVRHLRDNAHENQVSKAHLLSAVNELERSLPQVYYFPAYEIMMDELRDYRFYEPDMVHPSPVAVDYIRERFAAACLDERSRRFIREYTPVRSARAHRMRFPAGTAAAAFVRAQLAYLDNLEKSFPGISFESDLAYFNSLA
jgi:hypothetical protein